MLTLILTRTKQDDQGTHGILVLPDGTKLNTGELPWRDNDPDLSCVPPTDVGYLTKFLWSPHFGSNKYHLTGVVNRQNVELHRGNYSGDTLLKDASGNQMYASDVEGCILLGESLGILCNKFGYSQEAVISSVPAVQAFEKAMNGQDFLLLIKEEF